MIVTTPPKVYPPIGRCIYCGTTQGDLRREHVLPFGLGGNFILPKASCRDCEKITGAIEGTCLRGMFGSTRIRLNLPTRRPKERPKELPLRIVGKDGREEIRPISMNDYPTALAMYVMPPPGIITGAPVSHLVDGGLWVSNDQKRLSQLLTAQQAEAFRIATIPAESFMRMLAKIAFCYAVGELGLTHFRPIVRDFILRGSAEMASYYVGGDLDIPPAEDALHGLWFSYHWTPKTRFVVITVRLFAMMGSPKYHIVVGEG